MANYKTVFLFNSVTLVLVGIVTACLNLFGSSVKGLFLPPCSATYPGAGFFFLAFQMLFYWSVMVCAFTFGLLRIIQPDRPENRFILYSALFAGCFLFNEVFRTHVHLGRAGFPKVTIVIFYAWVAIAYGLAFRRQIRSTPYALLLSGVGLLFVAFFAEALPLKNEIVSSLLEGIPKLLSGINIALYFWFLCQDFIVRSLNFSNKTSHPE
ncbi:hypothetical protein [Microcoleus vaginatus]|uniref:hypothetical protein n=1 Tax=Microcoleus vaginatus TaxID=119532 RepID=UPI001681CC82|nr:hypothetical protein [Microcoleus sp. FACHB-84]MBD2011914.1 hypothetical protein [Microcoleus sp. FACHB-45]